MRFHLSSTLALAGMKSRSNSEHRLTAGKWTAYEEDIRVPLIERGPDVPEGRKLEHPVLNNDFAPTFADLAGAKTPSFVDGRSLGPLLTDNPPPPG